MNSKLSTLNEQVKQDDGDTPSLKYVSGCRQLRAICEAEMTLDFNLALSRTIDALLKCEEERPC